MMMYARTRHISNNQCGQNICIQLGIYNSALADNATHTFGKLAVSGTVTAAKTLQTFFMVPAETLPSIPSCALLCKQIKDQL